MILWSLKGKVSLGRAYLEKDEGVIFINRILEDTLTFSEFLCRVMYVLLHEELHLWLYRDVGSGYYSEVRVVGPVAVRLMAVLMEDVVLVGELWDCFEDVGEWFSKLSVF